MKFISVWTFGENQLDYDTVNNFDKEDLIIIGCDDYKWKDVRDFKKRAEPGNFIFVQSLEGFEGLIFRNE